MLRRPHAGDSFSIRTASGGNVSVAEARARVGIAQGYATIGAIGFEGRLDYGAIGTVTNLAYAIDVLPRWRIG